MNILLTNDDGINALGIRSMYTALCELGHDVHVVAPLSEQSAVGHALTIFKPLQVKEISEPSFKGIAVHGTPTDCVKLALTVLLKNAPDLVISGINAGANVGPDILYSGTVAAATEGAHSGHHSLAISYDNIRPTELLAQARHAAKFVKDFDWESVPARCVLNMNYPNTELTENTKICFCPQTSAIWHDTYEEHLNPRGDRYWWLKGEMKKEEVGDGTDRNLLSQGHITVTPLRFEFTHVEFMQNLQEKFSKS